MRKYFLLSALMLLWAHAQNAWAFYNPELGRWVNRDPIGEVETPNLYTFVLNNPVQYFDAVGFAGTLMPCSSEDEKSIRNTLNTACSKFNDEKKCQRECLEKAIGKSAAQKGLQKIRNFCSSTVLTRKLIILCDYSGIGKDCKNNVAYGDPRGAIVFCPKYFRNETDYTRECVAIHEIAHWGWDELDNASAYDKCFGCPGTRH